jgi:FkbM family methyltransferase
VANVALHQARELARYFRVTLVSDSFPAAELAGVAFHRLSPPCFDWLRRYGHVPREVAFALSAKAAIAKLHAQADVNVVLCHGHPVAALAAKPLKRRLGIPYAMVTHGDIFDRPKGTYDARLTWFYRQVTRPAYRGADLVVALSPHMREMALRGGAAPERVVVIPNGIDPAEIGLDDAPPASPRIRDRLELLYVGRLSVEKGVDVLIDVAALLKARGVAFRLRITGGGPETERLRWQVARSNLDELVQFLGPVPRLHLGALYRSADVVCVPSRSDSLPTVVLEAMVAGVAVLGTDTGGIPFMVRDGESGWIVPREDLKALADVLAAVSTNPAVLIEMGLAGRREATQHFNWEIIGGWLGDLINLIPDNPKRSIESSGSNRMDWKTWIKQRIQRFTGVRIYRYSLPRGVDFAYDARHILIPDKVSVIFDVGANIGQSTEKFRSTYPNAKIFCFEPVSSTFQELNRRVGAWKKIKVFQLGFGSVSENREIYVNSDSSINSFVNSFAGERQELVKVQTLDDFCLKSEIASIDLLKIDVEGYEIEVLQGAERMLSEQRIRSLYLETTARPNYSHYFVPLTEIDKNLAQFGYSIFGIYEQEKDQCRGMDYLYFFNVAYILDTLVQDKLKDTNRLS